jgi:hydroxyacylglutathione hydrolase
MDRLTITPLPAFTDNYLWLLQRGRHAAVVDPGDAAPVERALRERNLALAAILVTHHHPDHIGGLPRLAGAFPAPVYGPAAEAIAGVTQPVAEGDRVVLPELGAAFTVWEVPGHTRGHVAYVADAAAVAPDPGFVLCGDTLFSAGCGRLFEGTARQLHGSLARLASLPPDTRVYCTHEYTLANLAFAAAVEPGSEVVAGEIARVRELRAHGAPSLPSTIARERRINPFLRAADPAVAAAASRHAGRPLQGELEVFTELRRWKDGFRA